MVLGGAPKLPNVFAAGALVPKPVITVLAAVAAGTALKLPNPDEGAVPKLEKEGATDAVGMEAPNPCPNPVAPAVADGVGVAPKLKPPDCVIVADPPTLKGCATPTVAVVPATGVPKENGCTTPGWVVAAPKLKG